MSDGATQDTEGKHCNSVPCKTELGDTDCLKPQIEWTQLFLSNPLLTRSPRRHSAASPPEFLQTPPAAADRPATGSPRDG